MSNNNIPITAQSEKRLKQPNDTEPNETHVLEEEEEEVNSKPSANMNLNDTKQPCSTSRINIDEINPFNDNDDYDINSNLFF